MHVEGLGAPVYRFAQGFAWLEVGYALFRDRHGFAAAWIAAHARRAVIDGKTAKAPNLDPMAFDQGLAHGVQNGLDGVFGIARITRPVPSRLASCARRTPAMMEMATVPGPTNAFAC